MTLTIGRFSTPDEATVDQSGNSVTFGFHLRPTVASDDDHFHALVQQVLGLVDNEDEEVVPVTWSQDATFDGFYRVSSVSVPNSPIRIRDGIVLNCSITLERLRGYANPYFEVTTQAVVLTNGHSITTPTTVVGYNVALTSSYFRPDLRPSLTGVSTANRHDEIGQGTDISQVYRLAAPLTATQFRFAGNPARYYYGACKIEIKYGSTWYVAIGRQVPGPLTTWRLTNGSIRFTFASGQALAVEIWSSTSVSWESAPTGALHAIDTSGTFAPAHDADTAIWLQPEILRNGPEHVIVRVNGSSRSFTYSLQRGAYLMRCSWTDATAVKYGFAFNGTVAMTALTGGAYQTSNDANGNRMVFGTAAARTNDLVNGKTYVTTAATTGSLFVGMELDGSSANAANVASALVDQFIGATSWSQRVIVR
jgi:hypothetical protein